MNEALAAVILGIGNLIYNFLIHKKIRACGDRACRTCIAAVMNKPASVSNETNASLAHDAISDG